MFVFKKHVKKIQKDLERIEKKLDQVLGIGGGETSSLNGSSIEQKLDLISYYLSEAKTNIYTKTVEDIMIEESKKTAAHELLTNPMFANSRSIKTLEEHFKIATDNITVKDGFIMEFGVFQGRSINMISGYKPNSAVYGFDSFEGLPDDWGATVYEKGHFKVDNLPEVNPNVTLVKGWYDQTLPKFVEEHKAEFEKNKVALIHIDCDMYSSTKTVFDCLKPYIVPGTVIIFDELVGYPRWEEGEWQALNELLDETGYKYKATSTGHILPMYTFITGIITE